MCCACATVEEEQLYFIDENANIDADAIDADLINGGEEEEQASDSDNDEPLAADEIKLEDLENLDEDGWTNLITEQIDPFNPAMNWAEITETL
jgi:hypothetical protein